jgi:hypothetical protein
MAPGSSLFFISRQKASHFVHLQVSSFIHQKKQSVFVVEQERPKVIIIIFFILVSLACENKN